MNITIILTMIASLQVTSYRSVKQQTDSSPYNTSTGERVSPDGVAVSQDLICPACKKLHKRCKEVNTDKLHYNDWVYIDEVGFKRVNDLMNERYTNRMDVWVPSLKKEKEFHKKFKSEMLKVYKLNLNKRNYEETNKK